MVDIVGLDQYRINSLELKVNDSYIYIRNQKSLSTLGKGPVIPLLVSAAALSRRVGFRFISIYSIDSANTYRNRPPRSVPFSRSRLERLKELGQWAGPQHSGSPLTFVPK